MKTISLSKEFRIGALIGGATNFVALNWAVIWLLVGFLGAGMSSQPAGELQQTVTSFIWMASCCPVVVNLILLGVGGVRRQPRFLGGCLIGFLANLLLAACGSAALAGLVALNVGPNGLQP